MNLLLVARYPVGGIKTYIKYIYGDERFKEAKITLMAPDENLKEFLEGQLPPDRISLIDLPPDFRGLQKTLRRYLRSNPVDIVHSHGFSASMFVQLALLGIEKPHVMTAHDVFLENTFTGLSGYFKYLAMKWLLNSATIVLSVSEDARHNIFSCFPKLNPKKVVNITNGIVTRIFNSCEKRSFHEELGIPKERKLLGFFGRFMAQKGFWQIIAAMEILKGNLDEHSMPIVLTFGWGGFIREDYALIEEKGLSNYFVQLPGTNDMASAIRGVDCVLMPSRWEACPLLPMEVLCCGVPIIGSDCIGLREVLADTPAKQFPVGNVDKLVSAITIQLQEGAKDFDAYRPKALERFDAKHHVSDLYKIYEGLLSNTP